MIWCQFCLINVREIPGTSAISKMELFVTLVNGLQLLTSVTKNSILDVAGVLDTPLNEALSGGGSFLHTVNRPYLQVDIKENLPVSSFKPNLKP